MAQAERQEARPAPGGLPPRGGASFKPEHAAAILAGPTEVGWFEVHAENYMGAGGLPHRLLGEIRARYPLSIHGVGLSIGGAGPLDRAHLGRLAALLGRYQPASFSEHLAWSSHEGIYFNDLLPLPYNGETLAHVTAHIDEVQEALGRQMLLENPASYLAIDGSEMDEIDFLSEIARRTGCGLLLDINNVVVAAANCGFDAWAYLDRFALDLVGEIHIAGHAVETDGPGGPLLIDTHDRPVAEAVWPLYGAVIAKAGPKPTLVEWDAHLPPWPVLRDEVAAIDRIIAQSHGLARRI
ncbi:MAG TPA: DUF692 domain-containing protein [Paracoccaceae bacterium]|nr:DUF692 domain-containing protein [Paracoccaceae bacterium]